MSKVLLALLTVSVSLCTGCMSSGTWDKLEQAVASTASVTQNLATGLEVAKAEVKTLRDAYGNLKGELTAGVKAITDDALLKVRNAGLNVDGSAGDLLESAKAHPAAAASVIGPLATLLAYYWATKKKALANAAPVQAALNAVVDTVDSLPAGTPITKEALLAGFAAHPQMDGDARLAVAEAQAR